MKIIRDIEKLGEAHKNAVIALGNFDGFHLGHRAIIAHAAEIAKAKNLPLTLMTFEPHPREFFAKDKLGMRIYSLHSKLKIAHELGVEKVFLLRFNADFASLGAEEFIREVLVKKLSANHIITGENFCFGKDRKGDKDFLGKFADDLGFAYTAHPHIDDADGKAVSSSTIRDFLAQGKMQEANKLLGKNYHIEGKVKHGKKRGQTIGFPTANLALKKLFLPRFGVYAVRVTVKLNNFYADFSLSSDRHPALDAGSDDKTTDGIYSPRPRGKHGVTTSLSMENNLVYNAVANLGIKPTFGVFAPVLEVHIFDFAGDLYGKRICVEFIDFIRDEQKFVDLDSLKKQIENDCNTAKAIQKT